MALTLNLTTSAIGVPVTGAYARIGGFFMLDGQLAVDVVFHASKACREAGAREVDFRRYALDRATLAVDAAIPSAPVGAPSPTGLDQFQSALYAALKALPDFAAATDC